MGERGNQRSYFVPKGSGHNQRDLLPSTSVFLHCVFLAKAEELIRKQKNIFRVNELSCITGKSAK